MVQNELHNILKAGDKLTIRELRELLQPIYVRYGIHRKPKSTDLALLGVKTKRAIITKEGQRFEGIRIIEIS